VTRDRPRALSPYEVILGTDYDTLHPNVRAAHEPPLEAVGVFDVVHGAHPLGRVLVPVMKLPAAGNGQPVRLRVTACVADGAESILRWSRQIGGTPLETRQRAWRGLLVEEAAASRIHFALRATCGALQYEHVALRLCGMPLPAFVSPRVRACVSPEVDGWSVDVIVEWRQRLICRYGGRMRVEQRPS
jgi:hypothetical protein